jgi:zinc transporter ZupT
MTIQHLKFAAAAIATALIGGAVKTLLPAMTPVDARIEDHPVAFWCLLAGITVGIIAGMLDILDKGLDAPRRRADHDL